MLDKKKKKECQNGSNDANLSITDLDDTVIHRQCRSCEISSVLHNQKKGHYSLHNHLFFDNIIIRPLNNDTKGHLKVLLYA